MIFAEGGMLSAGEGGGGGISPSLKKWCPRRGRVGLGLRWDFSLDCNYWVGLSAGYGAFSLACQKGGGLGGFAPGGFWSGRGLP